MRPENVGEVFDVLSFPVLIFVRDLCLQQSFDFPKDLMTERLLSVTRRLL